MRYSIGQVINNRYRIVRLLGQGGFGAVYRAWDLNLNQACALKENLDTSPEAQLSFTREASVLARLSHPNLPRVIDHFTIPGLGQYLVMDYVEGEDLETMLMRQGRASPEQAKVWVSQIADALTYLHTQLKPILHRDIKPANIRITPEGKAMLVDFGLAKIFDPTKSTTIGLQAGTPGFSPPEMYGKGLTDPRTDIYSLGATLYTILTGQEPPESVARLSNDTLQQAYKINPFVSKAYDSVIRQAMALSPSQRFQTAAEFKNQLEAATQTGQAYSGAPLKPAGNRKTRWSSVAWIMFLLALLALIGLLLFNPWHIIPTEQLVRLIPGRTPTATSSVLAIPLANTVTETSTPTPTLPPTDNPPTTPTPTATLTLTPTNMPTPTVTPRALSGGPIRGGADKLAFIANQDIYVSDMDGANVKSLTTNGVAKSGLQWTPDGGSVLYLVKSCLLIVDVKTSAERTIFCAPWEDAILAFEVSPDGKKVALSMSSGLYIMDYDLENFSQLRTKEQFLSAAKCNEYHDYPTKTVHWSADNRSVAAVVVWKEAKILEMIHIFNVSSCGRMITVSNVEPWETFYLENREYRNKPEIIDMTWNGLNKFVFNTVKVKNEGYPYLTSGPSWQPIQPNEQPCCYRNFLWTPDQNYLLYTYFPSLQKRGNPMVYLAKNTSTGFTTPVQIPLADVMINPGEDIEAAFRPAQ